MTREGALLVILGVVVVLVALGVIAWRRRARRDAGIAAPVGEIPAGARTTYTVGGFYVASTRRGEPLERLAIRGLGFRSRAEITVTDRGVALDLPGQARFFVPVDRIDAVDLATVAIDRVVEPGGLVRLAWQADGPDGALAAVDTYLRPQDGVARTLADAVAAVLSAAPALSSDTTATSTGPDA